MKHRNIKYWFGHALIHENLNYRSFGATLTPPVTHATISRVLSGATKSPRVEGAIIGLINRALPQIFKRLEILKDSNHPLWSN